MTANDYAALLRPELFNDRLAPPGLKEAFEAVMKNNRARHADLLRAALHTCPEGVERSLAMSAFTSMFMSYHIQARHPDVAKHVEHMTDAMIGMLACIEEQTVDHGSKAIDSKRVATAAHQMLEVASDAFIGLKDEVIAEFNKRRKAT